MDTTTATMTAASAIIRNIDACVGGRLISSDAEGAQYDMGRIVAAGPGFIRTNRAGELIRWTVAPDAAYLVA